MAIYDQNQDPPVWTPPTAATGPLAPDGGEVTTGGDRWALIALAVSLTVIGSCVIPGFSCLAPLIAGIVALVQAKHAANPSRARTYGWIATGIGIFILLAIAALIALYGALFFRLLNDPSFGNEFR
jgi:Na+-driven multidrug efflux pump